MQEKTLPPELTLTFLLRNGSVWLAKKTRTVGVGCRTGYGGGIEKTDRDIVSSAIREISEECGVEIPGSEFEKVAVIDFHHTKSTGENFTSKVYVFLVKKWEGTPQETKDKGMVDPREFKMDNLPFDEMMLADKEWLPLVLSGKKIIAEYHYGPFQRELIKPGKLEIVQALPDEKSKSF